MKRSVVCVSLLIPLLLSLGGCTNDALMQSLVPPLPFVDPNILGIERASTRSLETIEDALVCLASRQPVFAMTAENSNVRPGPETGDCRVGRIPQGRLVRISGAYETGASRPLVSLNTRGGFGASGGAVGYEEDVQPIFARACNSCHSGIVQMNELQVTEYGPLMAGGINGPVVVPGEVDESFLWEQIETARMPMVGELSELDKETVRLWIEAGAPERRSGLPRPDDLWFVVDPDGVDEVPKACDGGLDGARETLVNAELVLPLNCAAPPDSDTFNTAFAALNPGSGTSNGTADGSSVSDGSARPAYATGISAGAAGIQAAALGLPAPADDDGWMDMRGGFCVERRQSKNDRSITAITFAPDGRMFLALDSPPTGDADPLILYDAHHPSRSIVTYDYVNDTSFQEIFGESTRITGLDYANGAIYITRAGEVGRIPDGGSYESLANGFAVNSQLFHANNGIVVSNGYVYISAGGIIDGYSDGPIVDIPESAAQSVVSGGNPYAARIVRAPLDRLLGERAISAFETAARGARNPYGITTDPSGRIWFTDNGATNLPDDISAGDEVNVLNPGAVTGVDETSPYYGFPLALNGNPPDWYVDPAVALANTAAPTGITWAYNTIFFGQYGKDPGLYRLGRSPNGQIVAERVMLVWPLLATATAPDGALWIGTGTGELYRITPGCGS